ncbi:MAG TPA: hypothetical protein VFZ61_24080 [Polyangiales bacterium]
MSLRLKQALRRLTLYWGSGLLLLALMWCAPLSRRLTAGLVRLAIAVIAPALSTAEVEHDPAVPTWMFALGIVVAGGLLGLLFFAAHSLWRASSKREG